MTPGSCDSCGGIGSHPEVDATHGERDVRCDDCAGTGSADRAADTRILKAAPVLLEIAAAALALKEAKSYMGYLKQENPVSAYHAISVAERRLKSSREAYDAALAKVV